MLRCVFSSSSTSTASIRAACENSSRTDGVDWTAVELDAGEPIPPLEDYDALWVMGGPMDVWDVAEHPWLVPEKRAIRRWVRELEKPFLGLCLGHQLLADALGGTCGPQRPPEIGILEVELTPEGEADPIFAGMPPEAEMPAMAFGVRRATAGGRGRAGALRRLRRAGDAHRPPRLVDAVPRRDRAGDGGQLGGGAGVSECA